MWVETQPDPVHKNYYQYAAERTQRTANTATAEAGYKDQNSSIHLLEAYRTYSVWQKPAA
jgi:mannobiose 2-epimerase